MVARRIQGLDVKCGICGGFDELDKHALFEYVVSQSMYETSCFAHSLQDLNMCSVQEVFMVAKKADKE